jgi:hypothetical protein
LASFAPKFTRRGGRELFVSRKGAKPAKQQWELLVFGCGYAALGSSPNFMVLIIMSEKQVFTGLYYRGSTPPFVNGPRVV